MVLGSVNEQRFQTAGAKPDPETKSLGDRLFADENKSPGLPCGHNPKHLTMRRFLNKFFQAPSIRQLWAADGHGAQVLEHYEVGWTELFIDLVFVGQFIVLAENIKECGQTFDHIFWIWTVFTIAWGTRNNLDAFNNRFKIFAGFAKLLDLWFVLGLLIMIANHTPTGLCSEDTIPDYLMQGFGIGFLMCRACTQGLYAMIMKVHPEYQYVLGFFFYYGIIQNALFAISLIILDTKHSNMTWVFYVVAFSDFLLFFILRVYVSTCLILIPEKLNFIPLNIWRAQERHSIFIVMVLGESVIALTNTEIPSDSIYEWYVEAISSLILLCTIAYQYFKYCIVEEHEEFRLHAMRRNGWAGVSWICAHNILAFLVFLIGPITAISISDLSYVGHVINVDNVDNLGYVIFGVHCLLVFIDRAHECFYLPNEKYAHWRLDASPWFSIIQVLVALLHFAVIPVFRYSGDELDGRLAWVPLAHAIILYLPRSAVVVQYLFVMAINSSITRPPSLVQKDNSNTDDEDSTEYNDVVETSYSGERFSRRLPSLPIGLSGLDRIQSFKINFSADDRDLQEAIVKARTKSGNSMYSRNSRISGNTRQSSGNYSSNIATSTSERNTETDSSSIRDASTKDSDVSNSNSEISHSVSNAGSNNGTGTRPNSTSTNGRSTITSAMEMSKD